MTEWWTRDATVCTWLVVVLVGVFGWIGGPIVGATGAVASLSAPALARWTAPPLTQVLARVWCTHHHMATPPRPPRAVARRGILTVAAVFALNAGVDVVGLNLITAVISWSEYVGAVTLGGLILCRILAPATARKWIADRDAADADAEAVAELNAADAR